MRDIMVTGSTVFSDEEINQVTAPYKNRTLSTEDLERLRLALTLLYINKGYLTSGAIIPDQDVQAGVVAVHILEGVLTNIHVEGNRWFRSAYIHDRIELGSETPVRMEPLEDQLQILQQDRRIERINAELKPGDAPGQSELNVRVQDKQPFHAIMEVNNYQTPLVGEIKGVASDVSTRECVQSRHDGWFGVAEVVHDHDIVARCRKMDHGVRTDVAGATADQYSHAHTVCRRFPDDFGTLSRRSTLVPGGKCDSTGAGWAFVASGRNGLKRGKT